MLAIIKAAAKGLVIAYYDFTSFNNSHAGLVECIQILL